MEVYQYNKKALFILAKAKDKRQYVYYMNINILEIHINMYLVKCCYALYMRICQKLPEYQ